MKKIVALAFGICLMGGAVSAQTLDSKYGLDSVKTEKSLIHSDFILNDYSWLRLFTSYHLPMQKI